MPREMTPLRGTGGTDDIVEYLKRRLNLHRKIASETGQVPLPIPHQSAGMDRGLFNGAVLARTKPTRPLGALSDFVVEEMPSLLAKGDHRGDHAALFAAALDEHSRAFTLSEPDTTNLAIACLDLVMLGQACDHQRVPLPDALQQPLQSICQKLGRLDAFLYEDCVVTNPLDTDPRLFTTENAALAERDFLLGHAIIESLLLDANARIIEILIETKESADPGQTITTMVAEHGDHVASSATKVRDVLHELRKMPLDDFARFRRFYMPSPRTGRPGPSGRYSANLYLLRVLVEGASVEAILPGFLDEMRSLYPYFARRDRDVLLSLLPPESGVDGPLGSLRQLAGLPCAQTSGLVPLLGVLRGALDVFSAIHFRLVKQNLEVYQ